MASRTREPRIIAAVACPICGVGVGQRCITRPGATTHLVRSHQERRWAWEEHRGPVAPEPVYLCPCGHSSGHHGKESIGEYGCDECDCERTREQVRRDGIP